MRSLAPGVVVLTLVVLGTACGTGDGGSTVATPTTTERSSGERFREAAPNIVGTTLEGEPITLGDFRGRPVMINVWSSW